MDPELINKIAEQVAAVMKARGLTPAAADSPSATAALSAAVHSHTYPGTPATPTPQPGGKRPLPRHFQMAFERPPQTKKSAEPPAPPPKVFLTAEMLQQRIAGGMTGTVELAPNEYLTPAAEDLAERRNLMVRRAVAKPTPAASVAAPGATAAEFAAVQSSPATARTLGVVTAHADGKVSSVLESLAREGAAIVTFARGECWMCNLSAMCEAIQAGRIAAGVAILPHAAGAMVLANKIRGILAVQGTRAESVAAAVRQFGANVLVLEHAFATFHELRTMVQRFAAPTETPTARSLLQSISERERS